MHAAASRFALIRLCKTVNVGVGYYLADLRTAHHQLQVNVFSTRVWWFYICNQRKMQQPFDLKPRCQLTGPRHAACVKLEPECRLVTPSSSPDWSLFSTCWSILKIPNFKFVFLQKCLRNLADCGPPGCCERVDVTKSVNKCISWDSQGAKSKFLKRECSLLKCFSKMQQPLSFLQPVLVSFPSTSFWKH